ncbi:MAG: cytochrome C [Deltaproteobacteria bacterium]|nr:cytochrome C [Deltaproteobacteria bacterium]
MSDAPERHSKHLYRAVIVIVGGLIAIFSSRLLLMPKSFGEHGWYRFDNVAEQMAKPVKHGGNASCKSCHGEQSEQHDGAGHATVPCESCHAPLATHVKEKKKSADMKVERTYKLCARCHQKLEARPKDFPQVVLKEHLEDQGETLEGDVCLNCHQPHAPLEDL